MFSKGKSLDTVSDIYLIRLFKDRLILAIGSQPSITDGVHRNENFIKIIPVFSTFSNFFKKRKKKL